MPRGNAPRRSITQRIAEIDREREQLAARDASLSAEKAELQQQLNNLNGASGQPNTNNTPHEQQKSPPAAQNATTQQNANGQPAVELSPDKEGPADGINNGEKQTDTHIASPSQRRLTKKQRKEEAELDKLLANFKAQHTALTEQPGEPSSPPRETTTKAVRRAKRMELKDQKRKQHEHELLNALHLQAMINGFRARDQNAANAPNHVNTTSA